MAGVPKEGEKVSGVYDAIVIGAGIMGSCTAYQIAKRGKSVLLLEQFDFLHQRGSSHGESRTIRVTYPELYYTKMMKEAYKLWEEAEVEAGYMVYHRTGQLDFGPHDSESLGLVVKNLQVENVEYQILTHQECTARFPFLKLPEKSLIVYTKQAGIIRATKAVAMFQSLALKHGAVLRDRVEILTISQNSELSDGSVGVLVSTGRGAAQGRTCIIAAGAWTPQILKELSGLELPVKPLHTSIAYWSVNKCMVDIFSASKGFPVFVDYGEPYIYGTPSIEYPGLIKVSVHSGTPCDPNNRSVVPDMEFLREAVSPWLASRFEGSVKWDAPVMAQGCMYSMTPDEDFILDFMPYFDKESEESKGEVTGINVLDAELGFFAQHRTLQREKQQSISSLTLLVDEADPNRGIPSESESYVQNGLFPLDRELNGNSKILVAAGFSGHGFKMGPLVGRIMADMALTGTARGVPLERFSIKRFRRNPWGNQKPESQVKPVVQKSPS